MAARMPALKTDTSNLAAWQAREVFQAPTVSARRGGRWVALREEWGFPAGYPRNMTVDELQAGFLKLAKQLYSAEETDARRRRFKRMLRTSPSFGPRVTRPEEVLAA